MGLVDFNGRLAAVRNANPNFDRLMAQQWGGALIGSLLQFLALSDADRKKWLADPANAALVAQLGQFMAWFESVAAGGSGTTSTTPTPPGGVPATVPASSIPPNAPVPPPSPQVLPP
jgi:hypothetical protein